MPSKTKQRKPNRQRHEVAATLDALGTELLEIALVRLGTAGLDPEDVTIKIKAEGVAVMRGVGLVVGLENLVSSGSARGRKRRTS